MSRDNVEIVRAATYAYKPDGTTWVPAPLACSVRVRSWLIRTERSS